MAAQAQLKPKILTWGIITAKDCLGLIPGAQVASDLPSKMTLGCHIQGKNAGSDAIIVVLKAVAQFSQFFFFRETLLIIWVSNQFFKVSPPNYKVGNCENLWNCVVGLNTTHTIVSI